MYEHTRTGGARPRVAFISTYSPVQCGIATFTSHIFNACSGNGDHGGNAPHGVIAVDDEPQRPDYGGEVVFRISKDDRNSYRHAAHMLNNSDFDVVCIQHEFGIFGGEQGSWILDLIRELRLPVVTVFHTVQAAPEDAYRATLSTIARESDHVVVITSHAITLLEDVYRVPTSHVSVIPHGVPDVSFDSPDNHKGPLGFEGRRVLMTFGLLGPTKGIGLALDALPKIVEQHPDVLYAIVGATHPGVIRHFGGDGYRRQLIEHTRQLGIERHVRFIDRYLDEDELVEHLRACDVYISPYPGRDQISSGTLSYAVGMGLAVVSTPYIYAQELLGRGRGCLVDFGSAESMSDTVNQLLGDKGAWLQMRQSAYRFGRRMTWQSVGRSYNQLCGQLHEPIPVTPPSGAIVTMPQGVGMQSSAGLLASGLK